MIKPNTYGLTSIQTVTVNFNGEEIPKLELNPNLSTCQNLKQLTKRRGRESDTWRDRR